MKLLTVNGNIKANKSVSQGYLTAFLHLAPSNLSGVMNTCTHASAGCRMACLNVSGMGKAHRVQNARIEKTKFFANNRKEFLIGLYREIKNFEKLCTKKGIKPAVRLNATSDIRWEDIIVVDNKNIMQCFPNIQFYDYTKIPGRRNLPKNYHLTFSLSESNMKHAIDEFNNYRNVAVVFRVKANEKLPVVSDLLTKNLNLPSAFVIDGDAHDLRFLDKDDRIVGLRMKNKAAKDKTGFVQEIS